MLIGRESEYAFFDECMKKADSQLVVFYGQKMLGKTTFILDYCKEKSYVYSLAQPLSDALMIEKLLKDVSRLKELNSVERRILIIDEFQNFSQNPEFMPIIADVLSEMNVLIVLVSSAANWVETSMVKSFGRSVTMIKSFYKCKKLTFDHICRIYSGYKNSQLFIFYCIFGGIPGLWQYFDPNKDVEENIVDGILSESSYLRQVGYTYGMDNLRQTSVYDTILVYMGQGYSKLNDLYRLTGFSRAKISVYLKTLMEYEQIEKIYSIETDGFQNSQKGIYRIVNHFTNFYFTFVHQREALLVELGSRAFYEKYIKDELTNYCSQYVYLLTKEFFIKKGFSLNGNKNSEDQFIGKKNRIDLIWLEDEAYHVVFCNPLKKMVTYDDLLALKAACGEADLPKREYYLVSSGDFDEKLTLESKVKANVHLVTFGEILMAFA